jgi:hypothetical protein
VPLRKGWLMAGMLLIIIAAIVWVQWGMKRPIELLQSKIKSGNLSVDYTIDQALADVERLSLNTVNVPVMVLVDRLGSSTMKLDQASMEKAKDIIKKLKKRNKTVILEPYPWIAGGEEYETNWSPSDIDLFFEQWGQGIIRELIEKVAVPEGVDVLCIASNLRHLEQYEEQWMSLVDEVRQRYDGYITYKNNWWYTAEWDESSQINFQRILNNRVFEKVDFISIGTYFELSEQPTNTVEELKEALYRSTVHGRRQNIVGEIEQLHERWNKPIFMGELGFPKRNYAAKEPWNPSPSNVYNGAEQARGFEAYRQVFTQDWFLGFSVFAIGETGEDKHYYPSEESAEVIRNWWE